MFYRLTITIVIITCWIAFSIAPAEAESSQSAKQELTSKPDAEQTTGPNPEQIITPNPEQITKPDIESSTTSNEKQVLSVSGGSTLPVTSGNQYFHDVMKPVLLSDKKIQSAQAAVNAAKEQIRIRLGARYPELELILEAGREDEYGKIDPEYYNDTKLKLTQLLWDFGKTDAAVEKARRQIEEQELNLERARQKLIVDAATAYQRLHRAYTVLQFSIESEANIRRQTGLEEIRVAEGFGYTTDVLQSKSQLAGAMSRRQRNEGEYGIAQSAYLEIFGTLPDDISRMQPIEPYKMISIPSELETVLKVAIESNLELQLARNRASVVETDIRSEKNRALFPDIEFALEGDVAQNYNQVFGNTKDYKASVTLKKKINLGLIENNKISAARHSLVKEKSVVADKEKVIEKSARTAWQRLKTAELTTQTLSQQADLTAAFLKLAREERALGTRSLMDILAGETALINARSDSYAAQIDISFAIFSMLEIMGSLDLDMFNEYW
ncbi:MAG: TolC family protein [Desulfamplus sp.]|nr:TolC family protein [Desulfamplus sp.]